MNISLGQLKKGENQTTFQIFKSLNILTKTLERWIKQLNDDDKMKEKMDWLLIHNNLEELCLSALKWEEKVFIYEKKI